VGEYLAIYVICLRVIDFFLCLLLSAQVDFAQLLRFVFWNDFEEEAAPNITYS
jgi:hypothetical protein